MMQFAYTPWWSSSAAPVTVKLEGYRDDDLIAYMIRTQKTFWELDLLEYVAMVGPRGGIFLDVGGNIGNHAVFFGLFCAEHVVTFEPHPKLQPILKRNLEANGLAARSTLVPAAMGAKEGTGVMSLREGYEQNIGASHVDATSSPTQATHPIQIRPLDSVVDELISKLKLPITFLKIDVEGMELEVLAGAMKTLEKHRPQLLVELITPETQAKATEILGRFGYREVTRLSDPPSYYFIDPSRHTLRPNLWKGGSYHSHQIQLAEEEVRRVTPEDAVLVVADSDELGLGGAFAGRRRIPFVEESGVYFGPPGGDEHAINELGKQRANGATHFVLAWPAFWYLQTYQGFVEHVHVKCRKLIETQRLVVFEL
jgi:FkbM family methyltransferase